MNRIAPRLGNIGARLRGVKKLFDLDERFREMDQFGDYREIISLPNPPIEDLADRRHRARAGAHRQRRHGGAVRAPPRALSDLRRGGVDDRRRGLGEGGAARGQGARRRRHPDLHQCRGQAARRSRLRADLRHHGRARPADLAASRAHRRHAGLSGRAEVALRDVVVLRLALRHLGGDGADGVQRPARPLSQAQDRHPSSRRHDPVLRRPHRRRACRCWAAAPATRTIPRFCRR